MPRYEAETTYLHPTLDRAQAAALLGVSDRTIDVWRADGKLRSIKVGGSVRFIPADIYELAGINTPPTENKAITEDQRIANYVRRVVDSMPKLTAEQRTTIATAIAVTPPKTNGGAAQ